MHYASGRLDPSIKAIARAANISESSVKRGLVKLKAAGVVTWLRRCGEDWIDGRFVLRQQTNAYGVLPASQWRGYAPPAAPPATFAGSWGDPRPPLPDPLTSACQEASVAAMSRALGSDPHDGLAAALGRLGRAIMGAKA
jgi:hypothetical protein